jgi:hypothetical protein
MVSSQLSFCYSVQAIADSESSAKVVATIASKVSQCFGMLDLSSGAALSYCLSPCFTSTAARVPRVIARSVIVTVLVCAVFMNFAPIEHLVGLKIISSILHNFSKRNCETVYEICIKHGLSSRKSYCRSLQMTYAELTTKKIKQNALAWFMAWGR